MTFKNLHRPISLLLTVLLLLGLLSPALAQPMPDPQQVESLLRTLSPEQRQQLREQLKADAEADAQTQPSSSPSPSSRPQPQYKSIPQSTTQPGTESAPNTSDSPANKDQNTAPARAPDASDGSTIPPAAEGLRIMNGLEKVRAKNRVDTLKSLERFGASFFARSLEELPDTDELSVPDDYQLVPGDKLNFAAYSDYGGEDTSVLEVDNDGQMLVPGIGAVKAGGLTKRQIDAALAASVASRFPGMNVRTTFVKVRKVRVFVLGESVRPGGYLMNPNATVLDALLHAGGPSEAGSYRDIRLERNGHTIRTFDLYDLLLRGKTNTPRLLHGDRIFVPIKGQEVSVAGEVQRPARYELRQEKTLADVLQLAGGLKPEAYGTTIQLERIDSFQKRKLLDLPLKDASTTLVKAGDLIYVNPVLNDLANGVYIEGAVKRPGWYQLTRGMRVSDLVRQAEGLEDGAFAGQAELFRTDSRSEPLRLIGFDLNKALMGDQSENHTLQSEDRVVVYSRQEALVDSERVRVQGEVKSPGEYSRFENMRVRDLLTMAGGLTPEASMKAELARPGANGRLTLIPIDLDQVIHDTKASSNLAVHDLDVLIIRKELRSKRWPASITLIGEFNNPGQYAIDPDRETLADVIKRAGGPTDLAYPRAAVFTRQLPELLASEQNALAQDVFADLQEVARQIAVVENMRQSRSQSLGAASQLNFSQLAKTAVAPPRKLNSILSTGRVPINLEQIISRGVGDPRVKDGDILFLPQKPEMVIVSGAVVLPSPIVWRPNDHVDSYIAQAGGFAEDAAEDKTLVLRVDGSLVKAKSAGALEPGDLILVPPKALVSRPGAFEQFLGVLQVIANGAFVWRIFR